MKVKVSKTIEIDVRFVRIVVPVRHKPNEFPCLTDNVWDVTVDIETGKILDWPGPAADFRMKVCDTGSYYLLGENKEVLELIENDYVPNGIVPGSYGDYIEMEILADGTVSNWPKKPDIEEFL